MSNKYYEYDCNVKIYSGKDSAKQYLPIVLSELNCHSVMIISGPVLNKIGIVDQVKSYCDARGSVVKAIFIDIPRDSSLEVVEKITRLFTFNGCDSIVAVGGGSVIDTAKGVKLVLEQKGSSLNEMMGLHMVKYAAKVPFVILPTTSGTGSELTKASVITDNAKGIKMEFISSNVLPSAAILDPELVSTLPSRATLLTGLDALSHAIEAYTSSQKNPLSDSMAVLAIDRITRSLRKAVTNGDDLIEIMAMMDAAALAGVSFSNSMVGAVHAIGHALGGECHMPHDQAMAILLPAVMEFNYSHVGYLYGELLFYLVDESIYATTPVEERGRKSISTIATKYAELAELTGAATSLRECGVRVQQFDAIIYKAMHDGARLSNIKAMTDDDIREILRSVY